MSDSESRHKTQLIQVRAAPEEKAKLKLRAAAFGISMGELCRQAIFNSVPKSKTDQEAVAELAATRADLGRLGGLFRGWLRGAFPESPRPPSKEAIEELLNQIEAAKNTVVVAVKKLQKK